jgi:hypothetical protein
MPALTSRLAQQPPDCGPNAKNIEDIATHNTSVLSQQF